MTTGDTGRNMAFAKVFDDLVGSNLALAASVNALVEQQRAQQAAESSRFTRLVRLTYGVLAVNAVLVLAVLLILAVFAMTWRFA